MLSLRLMSPDSKEADCGVFYIAEEILVEDEESNLEDSKDRDRLPSRLGSNGGEDSRSGEASNGAVLDQQSERVPYRLQSKVGEDSRSTEASNGIGQQSDAVPSLPGTQEGEDSRSKEASNQTDSDAQQSLRLPSLPIGTTDSSNGTTDTNEESSSQTQAQPIAVVVAVPDPTTVKVDSVKKWLASFSASSSIGTMSSSSSPGASSSPAPLPRRGNLRILPKRSYDEKDDDDDQDSGDDEYDVANDDPQAKKRRKEMEREAKKLQKEAKKKEKELQRKMRRQAELQRRQDRREEKERMAEAVAFQKRIEDDMREAEAIRKEEAEKLWRKQKIEDDFRKERKRASKRFSTELKHRVPQEEKPREHRSHSVDWIMLGESSSIDAKANNNGYFQQLEEMRKMMKRQFENSVTFMERSAKMDNGYYFKSIQDPFFRAAKMRQAETAPRNIFSTFDDELKIRPDDALLMFPQWNEEEQNKLDTCFSRFPTRGLIQDFGKLIGIEPMSQTVARIGINTVDRVTNPDARARNLEAFADKAALLLKGWKPEDPEEEMPRTGHYFLYVYKKVVKAHNWKTSGQMDFVRDLLFWLPVHLADLIGPLHVPRPSLHAICRQLFALLLDEWTVSMEEVLEEELQSLYRLQFASWRLECSMLQSDAPVLDMLPHWKPAKRPEGLFGHPEGPLETKRKRKSMELWKAKKGCRFNRRYSRRIEIQNNRKEEMILEEQPRRQAPRGRWQSCPPAIDSTMIQKRQRPEEERVRIPQNLLPDYWGGSF
ncbi:hypothetical protein B9Z55_022469 [Caenorhabditis nigoni]|uniref:Uncharacterized protein n=1 Tax=Caenorhabditis nigoni TaxID=1611254 RepID=A0A2G5SKH9_9PELO|nr:hypothetical protein B9Z55_022469 [Caenorhabditis nigoni]